MYIDFTSVAMVGTIATIVLFSFPDSDGAYEIIFYIIKNFVNTLTHLSFYN